MSVTSRRPIIAVTGLAFEARIAARGGAKVIYDANRERLFQTLEKAIRDGARGVISFGIAGGLAPHLRLGEYVVPVEIMTGKRSFATHKAWCTKLTNRLKAAHRGAIIGVDSAVADPAHKRHLHHGTGAIAVDMESHVAAEVALAYGIPFVALRVIADPAHRPLPPAALLPLKPNGSPDLRAIAHSVARRPRQSTGLMRLARDTYLARRALLRSGQLLGPGLGFPN